MKITAECSCGSTVSIDDPEDRMVLGAATNLIGRWYTDHKHADREAVPPPPPPLARGQEPVGGSGYPDPPNDTEWVDYRNREIFKQYGFRDVSRETLEDAVTE